MGVNMEDKKCCGVYDYDGVLVPGEELMNQYVGKQQMHTVKNYSNDN